MCLGRLRSSGGTLCCAEANPKAAWGARSGMVGQRLSSTAVRLRETAESSAGGIARLEVT